jgi:hypothetical protein
MAASTTVVGGLCLWSGNRWATSTIKGLKRRKCLIDAVTFNTKFIQNLSSIHLACIS